MLRAVAVERPACVKALRTSLQHIRFCSSRKRAPEEYSSKDRWTFSLTFFFNLRDLTMIVIYVCMR